MTDPRPVYQDPRVFFESDDTGEGYDPATQTVGWNLSFGCHLTVGMQDGHLQVQVSTSDADQRDGVTQRMVTSGQVRDFAARLIELADMWDVRQMAASAGCDLTALCTAGRHAITCLGLYRTDDEVRQSIVPDGSVLAWRRDNERFHRAYMRAGGGA